VITFAPGEAKTARVTMRNPTGKAFDYDGFVYMGTNLAVVSQVSFSLAPSEEKIVSFPVTMPSQAGTYPVYIGVFSGEQNIALYQATEDVVIQSPIYIEEGGIGNFGYFIDAFGYRNDQVGVWAKVKCTQQFSVYMSATIYLTPPSGPEQQVYQGSYTVPFDMPVGQKTISFLAWLPTALKWFGFPTGTAYTNVPYRLMVKLLSATQTITSKEFAGKTSIPA